MGQRAPCRSPNRDNPGVDSARPIGVVPFKWMGPGTAPENIGGIIAADLRNSGKFNPIDASRMPQQPSAAAEVSPAAWTALGIDAVVVGQVQPGADGSYLVSYQLVDTSGNPGSVLVQNQYKVTGQWLRYAAHTASDEVFEKLTGIKGLSAPVLPMWCRPTVASSPMSCVWLTMMAIISLWYIAPPSR